MIAAGVALTAVTAPHRSARRAKERVRFIGGHLHTLKPPVAVAITSAGRGIVIGEDTVLPLRGAYQLANAVVVSVTAVMPGCTQRLDALLPVAAEVGPAMLGLGALIPFDACIGLRAFLAVADELTLTARTIIFVVMKAAWPTFKWKTGPGPADLGIGRVVGAFLTLAVLIQGARISIPQAVQLNTRGRVEGSVATRATATIIIADALRPSETRTIGEVWRNVRRRNEVWARCVGAHAVSRTGTGCEGQNRH